MVEIAFNILRNCTDLIKAVAEKAPLFLILLPVFFLGGDVSHIILIAVVGWFFLGGNQEEVKAKLEEMVEEAEEQIEKPRTQNGRFKKTK